MVSTMEEGNIRSVLWGFFSALVSLSMQYRATKLHGCTTMNAPLLLLLMISLPDKVESGLLLLGGTILLPHFLKFFFSWIFFFLFPPTTFLFLLKFLGLGIFFFLDFFFRFGFFKVVWFTGFLVSVEFIIPSKTKKHFYFLLPFSTSSWLPWWWQSWPSFRILMLKLITTLWEDL